MKNSVRCQFVDIMKGWAMFVIIVFHAHNGIICNSVSELLHPWGVPVFFVLAGFFLKIEAMDTPIAFMKKKIKTLYIPATIMYVLSILMHNIFIDLGWYRVGELHPGNNLPFNYYEIKDFIIGCVKVLCCVGSGELIMGAMWFLYTLIYAFTGLCLLRYLTRNIKNSNKILGIILIIIALLSCVMTQKFNITINRVNVAMTAMLLIYIGMYINQYLKLKFDNGYIFTICLLLYVQSVVLQHITIVLAKNCYQDLLHLCIGTCCVVYILGYVAKNMENTLLGSFIGLMGKESLYLMALHILGFFICSSILWKLGVVTPESKHGMYTYCTGNNLKILVIYVLFGIFVPLVIVFVCRQIRKFVCIFEKEGVYK